MLSSHLLLVAKLVTAHTAAGRRRHRKIAMDIAVETHDDLRAAGLLLLSGYSQQAFMYSVLSDPHDLASNVSGERDLC
jgi:hypothetical protein